MKPAPPRIGGKDYSVYSPVKVRQGLRLWVEELLRSLPGRKDEEDPGE
jgi:hypothetical protein